MKFKFIVSGYGPYKANTEIDVGNMTILMGPNVVGKSYLIRAIYAMLSSCRNGSLDQQSFIHKITNSSICTIDCLKKITSGDRLIIELNYSDKILRIEYSPTLNKLDVNGECPSSEAVVMVPYNRDAFYFSMIARIYVSPQAIDLAKAAMVNALLTQVRGVLEKIMPEKLPEFEKLSVEVLKIRELDDVGRYFKEMLDTLMELIEKHTTLEDAERMRIIYEESFNAFSTTLFQPQLTELIDYMRPMIMRKKTLSEETRGLLEEVFPEIREYSICLPGVFTESCVSDYHLLPAGVAQFYPMLVAIDRVISELSQGSQGIFIIEEPELNLEPYRQHLLAQNFLHFVEKYGEKIMIIATTHSLDFVTSITSRAVARGVKDRVVVYEISRTKDRCAELTKREISEDGRVYLDYLVWSLGEIYTG